MNKAIGALNRAGYGNAGFDESLVRHHRRGVRRPQRPAWKRPVIGHTGPANILHACSRFANLCTFLTNPILVGAPPHSHAHDRLSRVPRQGKWRMTEPTDRRAVERFAVNADASCTFCSPVVEHFGPVRILNISMDAIGLLVSAPVKLRTLLAVSLASPARGFARTMLVRVVQTTPHPGGCAVVGEFTTHLTYQELTTLVM